MAGILLYDIRRAPRAGRREFEIPEEMPAQMLTGLLTRVLSWWLEPPKKYSVEEMAAFAYKMLYRRQPPAVEG